MATAVVAFLGQAIGTATVAQIIVNIAVSAAIGYLLRPTPPTSTDTGFQLAVNGTIEPRKVVYGEALVGGPIVYMDTTEAGTNSRLHVIVCLATHPVESFDGTWLNDKWIDKTDIAAGTYNVNPGIFQDGDESFSSVDGDIKIIPVLGWGWANGLYVPNSTIPAVIQNKIMADHKAIAEITSLIGSNWSQPADLTFGGDYSTWNYTDWNNARTSAIEGHKLTNCAYVYMTFKYDPNLFNSIPQMKGALLKGKLLFDPTKCVATGGTDPLDGTAHDLNNPATWEWSENWGKVCLDYLTNSFYGIKANTAVNGGEINWEAARLAVSDAAVSIITGYTGDSTEVAKYTVNGVLETNATPISNFEALLTSGAGSCAYAQGKYRLIAGVYHPAEDTGNVITEDDIVGSIRIQTATPRSSIFNKVAVTYIREKGDDREYVFAPTDAPLIDPRDTNGDNPYELEDGEEIIAEFDFPFTTKEFEAQRLGRINLERIRQGMTISIECKLTVLRYSVGDLIYFGLFNGSEYNDNIYFLQDQLGLNDQVQADPAQGDALYYKQFRITEMQYLENGNVALSLIEDSPDIYDWNEGDALVVDAAPNSSFLGHSTSEQLLRPRWNVPLTVSNFDSTNNTYKIVLSCSGRTQGEINESRLESGTLVSHLIVTNGGSGYVVGDVLTFIGGTFSTAAEVTVSEVSAGAITEVILTNPGMYTVAPGLTGVTGGSGTSAQFTADLLVTTPGLPYSFADYYEIEYNNTANPNVWLNGGVIKANKSQALQGTAELNIKLTETYDFRIRTRSRSSGRASDWLTYSDYTGVFFNAITFSQQPGSLYTIVADAPEAITIRVDPVNPYYFEAYVDIGSATNINLSNVTELEVIWCLYTLDPTTNSSFYEYIAAGTNGLYRTGYNKFITLAETPILADNTWVRVSDIDPKCGVLPNSNTSVAAPIRVWARLWTTAGPSEWTQAPNNEGAYEIYDITDTNLSISNDNLIDPETGEVINIVGDDTGGGIGPVVPPGGGDPDDPSDGIIPPADVDGDNIVTPDTGTFTIPNRGYPTAES